MEKGNLEITAQYEDHSQLCGGESDQRIGEAGKEAAHRPQPNDQVALDMRLYVRDEVKVTDGLLYELLKVLLDIMEKHVDTYMLGLPICRRPAGNVGAITWALILKCSGETGRGLGICYRRMNYCPLGAGLWQAPPILWTGTFTAELLGFEGPTRNSMIPVSDRDYAVEYLFALSLIMMH